MGVLKVECEICGQLISKSNIGKHLESHQNGNYDKNKVKYVLDHDDPFCKYCRKEYLSSRSLLQHEIRCPQNPNTISWNKGLTAENDIRVAKQRNTRIQNYKKNNPYPETELSKILDDDGKLYRKYRDRYTITNSRHFEQNFLLTYDEFCQLMNEAGIKSSDLGYKGSCYDLARYGDTGDYEIGNCRFITHSENLKERKLSKEALEKMSISAKNRKPLTEEEKAIKVQKFLNSDYIKRRKAEAAIREAERRSRLDPRFSGEHNSQLGSHWITNGEINKKLHPGDEMPEGFHFGRVNATKKMPQ